MLPNELFLSHAGADREIASHLAETLRRHGVPVWYSPTDIAGARQWHDEIGAALGRCDWFGLILTRNAVESMWVKRELVFALQQNRYQERIVPLLYEPCDIDRLSWVLPGLQVIDFRPNIDEGYRQLLRLWGIGYRPA